MSGSGQIERLSVAIIGPGRVGMSLGSWLRDRGAGVAWVAGRGLESAQAAARDLAAEARTAAEIMRKPWDLLLLAPPDDQLASIAEGLGGEEIAHPGNRVALHTSGNQSAEALAPLREVGVAIGSLHPLLGFPQIRRQPVGGTVYGIDGDEPALDLARRLALSFGGEAVEIPPRQRFLYHYCATLAAGGVSTLLAVVDELIDELGLDPAVRRGMLNLTRAAVDAAADSADAATTITGPIARGDAGLAERQRLAAVERIARLEPFLRRLHAETERQVARGRRGASTAGKKGPSSE